MEQDKMTNGQEGQEDVVNEDNKLENPSDLRKRAELAKKEENVELAEFLKEIANNCYPSGSNPEYQASEDARLYPSTEESIKNYDEAMKKVYSETNEANEILRVLNDTASTQEQKDVAVVKLKSVDYKIKWTLQGSGPVSPRAVENIWTTDEQEGASNVLNTLKHHKSWMNKINEFSTLSDKEKIDIQKVVQEGIEVCEQALDMSKKIAAEKRLQGGVSEKFKEVDQTTEKINNAKKHLKENLAPQINKILAPLDRKKLLEDEEILKKNHLN